VATKKTRKAIDWEKVESEYRAGQLSLREIGRQYDVSDPAIRKKAKALGWERDLSAKIKTKVRSDLVRSEVRTKNPQKEKEIIEAAAAQGVEVVRSHRKNISSTIGTVNLLLEQLVDAANGREEIEGCIDEDTVDDNNTQRRTAMLKAVSLPTHAQTVSHLSSSLKTLVALERQAFNLDDDSNGSTSSVEDFINEISKRTKPMVIDVED